MPPPGRVGGVVKWRSAGMMKDAEEVYRETWKGSVGKSDTEEHYSLKYGHLLMFKYERFSIFGVVIFDTSATEIVYPPYEERSTRKLYKRGGKKQSTRGQTY
ncbi:B3 domain-containing protein At1g49475 [Lactuca sativa]|uniref:B3 domain-containing protein At1g49475 n=1 Tax=Lactuca sativa TaxID=4236 RepID=UPI001C68F1DE|nr:B3 domain-containing protein At1g49475 [Lactuca sativa]